MKVETKFDPSSLWKIEALATTDLKTTVPKEATCEGLQSEIKPWKLSPVVLYS